MLKTGAFYIDRDTRVILELLEIIEGVNARVRLLNKHKFPPYDAGTVVLWNIPFVKYHYDPVVDPKLIEKYKQLSDILSLACP